MSATSLDPNEVTRVLTLRVVESMETSLTEAARRRSMTRSEMIREVLSELLEQDARDLEGEAA